MTLLLERWGRVKDGAGQVVILSGEAGIGKSRLVQALQDQVAQEPHTQIEYRCSPYHQHSALAPVIAHLERVLAWERDTVPQEKLRKLADALVRHPWPLPEVVPLLAALLSLPLPAQYSPLTLTPERQKQKTLEALLAWLLAETEPQPVIFIVEDLHWVDLSTLEWLSLVVEQSPTARLYGLFTCLPEFTPSWPTRAYLTPLTLSCCAPRQPGWCTASRGASPCRPRSSTDRGKNRWCAALRGRTDQDRTGVWPAARKRKCLRVGRAATAIGNPHDTARFPHGPSRSASHGQSGGTARGDHRKAIWL